jgi:hypothetical protein
MRNKLYFAGAVALAAALLLPGAPPHTTRGSVIATPGNVDAGDLKAISDRVLMIRDTSVVQHKDFDPEAPGGAGPWSFAGVVSDAIEIRAPGIVEGTKAGETLRQRLSSVQMNPLGVQQFLSTWQAADPNYSLTKAPVRLLAVVNRIDLGRVGNVEAPCKPANQFGGAEIRFIYSAATDTVEQHFLSMIVEFVLPCKSPKDFKTMGEEWSNLRTSANYVSDLEKLLQNHIKEATFARLRVISKTSTGGWRAAEYGFDKDRWLLDQTLARQFDLRAVPVGKCQDGSSAIGEFVTRELDNVRASNYRLDESLSTKYADLTGRNPTGYSLTLSKDLKSPSGVPIAPAFVDDARFSISVNTCTGCHGADTYTDFHQVNQRVRDSSSDLAAFLTGQPNGDSGGATGQTGYYVQQVLPLVASCGPPPAQRSFNDLLRRYVFLKTLINTAPSDLAKALDPLASYEIE